MHKLHHILVNLSDLNDTSEKNIRNYAEEQTECFYETVFDWRETDAGRWSGEYPNNVLFAKDDPAKFIKILEEIKERQDKDFDYYYQQICEITEGNTDLKNILSIIKDCRLRIKAMPRDTYMLNFYLKQAFENADGKYTFDSGFYNISEENSLITPQLLETVKSEPENYAMVLMDYHI